jgi:hypothetical protein
MGDLCGQETWASRPVQLYGDSGGATLESRGFLKKQVLAAIQHRLAPLALARFLRDSCERLQHESGGGSSYPP